MRFSSRVTMWTCRLMAFVLLGMGVHYLWTGGQRPDAWLLFLFPVVLLGIAAAIEEAAGSWDDSEE